IQELKSLISNLEKRLQKALVDIEHKEESLVILENRISNLQEEINTLKNRIQDLTSRKYKKLNIAQMSNIDGVQSIGESIQNTFNNISYVLRKIPGLPKNLEEEFTDIKKDVAKLQAIADREKNRANLSQTQINQDAQTIMRLNSMVRQSDDDLRLMTIAYYNEKNVRRSWYFSYKDKHRRVGELLREKLFYRKLFQINRDDRKALKFRLDTLKKAEKKRLMQKHLSEWDYKTREAKGLTIKVPMPNSPNFSSSFYSDSSDTGSLTGGMRQKFDTIHRHSRRTSDILGDIGEELHSSDNEDSGNSSNSIIIEGTSNIDIPPLFNDSNSSSSDDEEIRSSSSDDDIHARCRQIHIQNIRLRRKAEQDLLECRNERGLLEFNRDCIVNELEIAEDDINDQNRIINILNQENLLLRDNIHINNQHIGMVGYGPPIYRGNPGEDPEDFLRDFQRYVVASRINITPGAGGVAGRAEADGLFESCLEGPALNWYETNIKGKNWKCNNLSDNLGVATLTAVRTLGAGNGGNQIGGLNTANQFRGKAAEEIGRIGAGIAAGINIIPNVTWDEDWSIAGGEPTNNAPVAPNAGGGFPNNVTIAPGIKLGQKIYRLRNFYTTVEAQKQMAVFGQIMQGSLQVEEFSNKIKKIGKLAGMSPQQQREQFIRGLSPMNQYNIRMMAKFNDTMENITSALAEAEKYTLAQEHTQSSFPVFPMSESRGKDNYSSNTGMSKSEIENLIKSMIPSSEPQETQIRPKESVIQSASSQSRPQPPGTYKNIQDRNMESFLQWIYGEIPEFIPVPAPPLPPKPQIKNNGNSSKNAETDSDDELANRMNKLSINKAISKGIQAGVHAVRKSSQHRCSLCNKTGHNSRNCTKYKKRKSKNKSKKKGKVNLVNVNPTSDSSSGSSDNDSNSLSDSESDSEPDSLSDSEDSLSETENMQINISKSKILGSTNTKYSTTRKEKNASKREKNPNNIINDKRIVEIMLELLDGILSADKIEQIKTRYGISISNIKSDFENYRDPAP
ncbi:3714_t:CDS:2, partial [Entrophospora sp. SA101]